MSMNNVIDPGDVFRDLTSSDTASISSEEVDRLADQLTSTTENIRSLITRQRSQRTPPPSLPVSSAGGELEDIAKQIADHAETLYQTWRARGLTPNEVLRSHNTVTLNSEAAQTLSQRLRDGSKTAMISRHHSLTSSSQSSARSLGAVRSSSVPVPSDQPPSPFSASPVFSGSCSPRLSSIDHISQRLSTSPTPAPNPVVHQEHTIPIRLERSSSTDPPSVNGFSRTPPSTSSLVSAAPLVRHQQAQHKQQTVPSAPISPVDLLASPDNDRTLEEMVKSFVQEDKARRSSSTSSVSSMSSHRFLQKRGSSISSGGLPLQLKKPFRDGYRMLPVKSSSEDTTGLVGTSLSRLQVTTNGGETQVLHDRTGGGSVGGAWQPFPPGSGAAGCSELAVVDEVRRQEQRLRSALLVGAVTSQHPQREISPRPVEAAEDPSAASSASSLSTVDYAKRRLQDPHNQSLAAQRLEDVRSLSHPSQTAGASVQQARSRYDNGQINISDAQWRTDWLPGRHVDPDSGLLLAPAESAWRRKRALLKASAAAAASADHPHQPRTVSPLPHPELTDEQKQHIRERCTLTPTSYNSAGVAIRPFLTQGSVAERVLIFEKCPADLKQRATQDLQERMKQPTISTWRAHNEVKDKTQTYGRDKESVGCRTGSGSLASPSVSPKPSSPRPDKLPTALNSALIPRFHYPHGRPEGRDKLDSQLTIINQAFSAFPSGQVHKDKFAVVTKACGLPRYWKMPLFQAAGGEKLGFVTATVFLDFWKRLVTSCHDPASRFVRVLTAGQRNYLVPEDLVSLLQDVVEAHPGLNFLKEAVEFHSRYIHTVIARIFYCVNRSWSGRITVPELRRSNLLSTIQTLEHEEDINQITDFFSYEHFYVIYCKFWELDGDHDLLIDKEDLARHNDHAVSSRIIERIFSGAVTRSGGRKLEKMSYTEFVWFLLSEEDKKHSTAIEYWFRCMDLDGDGVLSMYELEYFYEEQLQRLDALGIDALPFEDCLCWMLDMVQPEQEGRITLSDLKRCRMANVFFDTFFNLEKYLEHDQRDPFAVQRDGSAAHTVSDWDRYAAEEYELLVAEESAAEPDPEFSMYDEEGEDSSMPLSPAPAVVEGTTVLSSNPHMPQLEADEADYALVASEECEGQLPHRTVAGMV